jgi:hypothetical protein
METVDILLIAGALVIVLFVALLFVVLRATARTAENAKEILLALEDIATKAKVLEQLDGAAQSTQRARSQLPGSTPTGNGSGNSAGEGTEVPS